VNVAYLMLTVRCHVLQQLLPLTYRAVLGTGMVLLSVMYLPVFVLQVPCR
jgi:hypothetical protein